MTLANQLTLLRICLVPALVILVVYGFFGWALLVFFVAAVTDALDGLMARMRHERTHLGTILDPLADKLLVTALLIVLALPSPELRVRIPPWIAILSIGRDAAILLDGAFPRAGWARRRRWHTSRPFSGSSGATTRVRTARLHPSCLESP
jgi:cardiolipin synthase